MNRNKDLPPWGIADPLRFQVREFSTVGSLCELGQLATQTEYSGANRVCTIVDGYDRVGNRVTRSLDGNPITWTYDDLYRLTGQQKAGQVCTYTMDGVGNLRTMWEGGTFPKTFTFSAADRLVTMTEGASLTRYSYTGYGALETEHTGTARTTFAYSGQDQLIEVTGPTNLKSVYTFDGDGMRRTVREVGAKTTTIVWDGSDYLLLNEPLSSRVVLTLEGEIVSCGVRDLLTDPLGSLVKEVSAGASLGTLVEMYPFGTRVSGTGTATTPFAFVGAYGYYTDTTDRDYVRARELMKNVGRWMQVDPLWPDEMAYEVTALLPDPFGLKPDGKGGNNLRKCKKLGKQACYLCAYDIFRQSGSGPYAACELATRLCGSKIQCGPCGHENVDLGAWDLNCDLITLRDTFGSWVRDKCGRGGADKLAHCFMSCMIQGCAGLVGSRIRLGKDEHEDDRDAEGLGIECGGKHNCSIGPPIWYQNPGRHCFNCCVEMTRYLNFDKPNKTVNQR